MGEPKEIGSMLSHLHIAAIKISVHAWAAISKGLSAESCVLKKFIVNLCDFDRASLNEISDGMCENMSVKVLDLSYNNIKDAHGDLLGRIISKQTQKRDEIKFKKELRHLKSSVKKTENPNDAMGLQEMILTNNKLGINFMTTILDALKYDTYLRVLDLRKNKLTNSVVNNPKELDLIRDL